MPRGDIIAKQLWGDIFAELTHGVFSLLTAVIEGWENPVFESGVLMKLGINWVIFALIFFFPAWAAMANPLLRAAASGNVNAVATLLAQGADPNTTNAHGATALFIAAANGHNDVIELLLNRGANIEAKTRTGGTAVMISVMEGHIPAVKLLLDRGADVNANDDNGITVLMLAAVKGRTAIARLLADKGADLNAKSIKGRTALSIAARFGYIAVVQLLLEKGADVNAKDEDGMTPLHFAALKGYNNMVQLLINSGTKPIPVNANGETPSDVAMAHGHLKTADAILSAWIEKRIKDDEKENEKIIAAAAKGDDSTVMLLLDGAANVNAKNDDGDTALIVAARNGYTSTVRLLLSRSANIEVKNNKGHTALMSAVANGHYETSRFIRAEGVIDSEKVRSASGVVFHMESCPRVSPRVVIGEVPGRIDLSVDSTVKGILEQATRVAHEKCPLAADYSDDLNDVEVRLNKLGQQIVRTINSDSHKLTWEKYKNIALQKKKQRVKRKPERSKDTSPVVNKGGLSERRKRDRAEEARRRRLAWEKSNYPSKFRTLIVGKWLDTYKRDAVQFFDDGRLVISATHADAGDMQYGRYRFVDEKTLEVRLPNANRPQRRRSNWKILKLDKASLSFFSPSNKVSGLELSYWTRVGHAP